MLWLSMPYGFLVVFEKPNRSSFTFTFTCYRVQLRGQRPASKVGPVAGGPALHQRLFRRGGWHSPGGGSARHPHPHEPGVWAETCTRKGCALRVLCCAVLCCMWGGWGRRLCVGCDAWGWACVGCVSAVWWGLAGAGGYVGAMRGLDYVGVVWGRAVWL